MLLLNEKNMKPNFIKARTNMPASLLFCKQFAAVSKHAFKVQKDIGSLTGDVLHCSEFKLTLNYLKLRLLFLIHFEFISFG